MDELLSLLTSLAIPFSRFDHPAVFTCEESDRLCPPMSGAHTKQLLMKAKGKSGMPAHRSLGEGGLPAEQFVLAIVMHDKKVDTKALAKEFGFKSFSFAQPDQLKRLLGVEPGSVTPFGLMFDKAHEIQVIVDEDAWNIGQFRFHPLVNTATLVIDQKAFEEFLKHTGHELSIKKIPV
jgi:Ala-tRNA(Pro) deacylase